MRLIITTDAPKRGPLSRAPAFEKKACAPVAVMALDPTTEDAGIDGAALSRNFVEGVLQICLLVHRTSLNRQMDISVPDEIVYAPVAVHD